MSVKDKTSYLARAVVARMTGRFTQCPSCERATKVIEKQRNYLDLVRLVACDACQLRYRIPTETEHLNHDFYQHTYGSGETTQVPDIATLKSLRAAGFKGEMKDFTHRIAVLQALGIPKGARVLDFGASWGYGTWQLAAEGFDAYGFEISSPRAAYAREELGATVCDNIEALPGVFDVIFTSHVVEHLPTPNIIQNLIAGRLTSGGYAVIFTPNGSEAHLQRSPESYNSLWHRVHPLYPGKEFYEAAYPETRKLFMSVPYDTSYPLEQIRDWAQGKCIASEVDQDELLFILKAP